MLSRSRCAAIFPSASLSTSKVGMRLWRSSRLKTFKLLCLLRRGEPLGSLGTTPMIRRYTCHGYPRE